MYVAFIPFIIVNTHMCVCMYVCVCACNIICKTGKHKTKHSFRLCMLSSEILVNIPFDFDYFCALCEAH